ncbi:MAG: ABC transporter permease [Cyclobacteriaceae bacterium]|jgi:putative ABC transport system permease protein|nr:ABC transporter permease [Flammeovirgaceae bacterium]
MITLANLRLAFRHLGRQKLNTSLHIIGLTLGLSVCIVIALFVRYELSFDAFHEKADQTYRVVTIWTENERQERHFSTPFPLANAIRNEVSGIDYVSFAHPVYTKVVELSPGKRFLQPHILAVEPEFPELFHLEPLQGDLYQALRQPYQAVLTESTAKKFFGNENPIGKTFSFEVNEKFEFTVAAIIRDLPANTHLPASLLVSYAYNEKFLKRNLDGWSYVSGTETLLALSPQANPATVTAQLNAIAKKNNSRSTFELQPLKDVHFNPAIAGGGGWVQAVSPSWLWFFSIIGILVLILACINFVNLSTAQAVSRAKEVGVRKSVGAGKFNLIAQFLLEAWVLTFIAGILSVAIAQVVLPSLNQLVDKRIEFNIVQSPTLVIGLIISVLLIGMLAGLYPAWVISRFNPTITLKVGTHASQHSSAWLRKALVVAQFSISVGLLMVVILMANQVNFIRTKNLGFEKENVINVEIKPRVHKESIFRNELAKIAQVKDISFATATPSSQGHWGTRMNRTGKEDPSPDDVTLIFGDDRFCKMYGLQLLAGRYLEPGDTSSISNSLTEDQKIMKAVVNEALIRTLKFESNEAAIGESIWIGWDSGHVKIVGVVANFNTGPLQELIKPALITPSLNEYEQAGIKIEAGSDLPAVMAGIEAAWKTAYPEGIFTYAFLDEQIDAFYKAEARLFTLFKIFASLAMFISCLGLWGLATFSAQARVKEIGMRKVLGASVEKIVLLLSKDFLVLVGLSLIIATPIAWYGMNQWLQNYAYRIDIQWWIFGLAAGIAFIISVATVSFQAIKAALTNPAESLKSE